MFAESSAFRYIALQCLAQFSCDSPDRRETNNSDAGTGADMLTKALLFLLVVSFFNAAYAQKTDTPGSFKATPAQDKHGPEIDEVSGVWLHEFNDTAGLDTLTNIAVSEGQARLQDLTQPGVIVSAKIIPESVAGLLSVSWNGIEPGGTEVQLYLLDEAGRKFNLPYARTATGGEIALVNLNPLLTAAERRAKILRWRIQLILSGGGQSPAIGSIRFNWTPKRLLSQAASIYAGSWGSWKGNIHAPGTTTADLPKYSALSWVEDYGPNLGGNVVIGEGAVYSKTFGNAFNAPPRQGQFVSHHPFSGARNWERNISGEAASDNTIVLSDNGSIFLADIFHDFWGNLNAQTGAVQATKQFFTGHGNIDTAITSGVLTTTRRPSDTFFQLVSVNSDFSPRCVSQPESGASVFVSESYFAQTYAGKLALATVTLDAANNHTGLGKLYLFDPSTCQKIWDYQTGDADEIQVAPNDHIYTVAQRAGEYIAYAFDSSGQLLWSRNLGPKPSRPDIRLDGSARLLINFPGDLRHKLNAANGAIEASAASLCSAVHCLVTLGANNSSLINTAYNREGVFTSEIKRISDLATPNWKMELPGAKWDQPAIAANGWFYAHLNQQADATGKLLAFAPWNAQVTLTRTGKRVRAEVLSPLPPVNPMTLRENRATLVIDSSRHSLTASVERAPNGLYRWSALLLGLVLQGRQTVTATVIQSQADVVTDTFVESYAAAANSGGTGVVYTDVVSVINGAAFE
jgi:hypothetical protein